MTAVVPDLPPHSDVPKHRSRTGIRVAAVPAGGVYVRHLTALTACDPVRRLPDPCPRGTPRSRWGWWPPAMLDPDWVRRHHDEFDVFHLHQGYESLENPYEASPSGHLARLDVLVPAAQQLITLTPGAATTIAARGDAGQWCCRTRTWWSRTCWSGPGPGGPGSPSGCT